MPHSQGRSGRRFPADRQRVSWSAEGASTPARPPTARGSRPAPAARRAGRPPRAAPRPPARTREIPGTPGPGPPGCRARAARARGRGRGNDCSDRWRATVSFARIMASSTSPVASVLCLRSMATGRPASSRRTFASDVRRSNPPAASRAARTLLRKGGKPRKPPRKRVVVFRPAFFEHRLRPRRRSGARPTAQAPGTARSAAGCRHRPDTGQGRHGAPRLAGFERTQVARQLVWQHGESRGPPDTTLVARRRRRPGRAKSPTARKCDTSAMCTPSRQSRRLAGFSLVVPLSWQNVLHRPHRHLRFRRRWHQSKIRLPRSGEDRRGSPSEFRRVNSPVDCSPTVFCARAGALDASFEQDCPERLGPSGPRRGPPGRNALQRQCIVKIARVDRVDG